MRPFFLLFLSAFSLQAFAQLQPLSTEQMLKGARTGITETLPGFRGWVDDNHFLWNRKAGPDSPAVLRIYDCRTGKDQPASSDKTAAGKEPSQRVTIREDDIFFLEAGKADIRLTQTDAKEVNPTLSPDGRHVAFTRDNDLYTLEIASKQEKRLTTDGSKVILNGYASWVYFEEILGRASRYRSFWWSPDSRHLAFMRMDDSRVPEFPIYGESGQYGYVEETRYPKAGDPNPKVKVGLVSVQGGQIVWADFNEDEDQYFGHPYWKPDGSALWVQWMNRSQDLFKIYEVGLGDGKKKEIYTEQQTTWIDLDDQGERIRFLDNKKGFILKSDRDGWQQLYLHQMDGRQVTKLTDGPFWAVTIESIDEKKGWLWFSASREASTRSDLYRVQLDGRNLQRMSFGEFTHHVDLSPGGSWFLTRYSNAATPDRMALVNTSSKKIIDLADSRGPNFSTYTLARTEILRVKSDDGLYDLPLRITWPLNYTSSGSYPVMISIYGGPNAGTVRDGWQFSGQQQWFAKEGLIQVSIDHRGSGHFGKTGMNALHRRLGYWELRDWITVVKWLRTRGADSTRVAISGFSYGGYMTCLALTAGADYFTHGLAGGSVTDWRLYDTHYTERFMDKPDENPEGYKNGSPLEHAAKYRGLLRIYHGSMDDNVHLQNSLQLVKKLQEQKKHFEFMVYPGGRHGWGGAQSQHSTNENNLFIYRNLLRKEMPKDMYR